jgi:hypothetical protein
MLILFAILFALLVGLGPLVYWGILFIGAVQLVDKITIKQTPSSITHNRLGQLLEASLGHPSEPGARDFASDYQGRTGRECLGHRNQG